MLVCELSTSVMLHERCCYIPWSPQQEGISGHCKSSSEMFLRSFVAYSSAYATNSVKISRYTFHLKGPIMCCSLRTTLSKTIWNSANTSIQRGLNWFSPWDNWLYTVKPMPAGGIHFIHQLKVINWKLPNNLLFSV